MDNAFLHRFHKKTLQFNWSGKSLRFDIPRDVFSTFQIDTGTAQLLKAMSQTGARWNRVLDLGCGYAPLAIGLAASGQAETVLGVDRDALAVAFARHNVVANGFDNITCRGGLAYDDLAGDSFDLIVTNLPAKAGAPAHRLMVLGAQQHLRPGGEVWMVAVRPLAEALDAMLAHPHVEVASRSLSNRYVLYNYRFRGPIAMAEEPYRRDTLAFEYGSQRYSLESVFGVPDFDSIWLGSELALKLLERRLKSRAVRRVAVYEPTQGHVPILLAKLWPSIAELTLLSRDRLALKASADNLQRNGYEGAVRCLHTIDASPLSEPGAEPDLLLFQVQGGEELDIQAQRIGDAIRLLPACLVVVACTPSFGGRLEKVLGAGGLRPSEQVSRKRGRALCYGG